MYRTSYMSQKTTTNGVVNIDKPAELTSHDVVAQIRRLLSPTTYHLQPKVGHTGTLDPFATGVLLVVIGPATRLIQFTHAWDKEYEGTFALGAMSDTDDIDGATKKIGIEKGKKPDRKKIEKTLQRFAGTIRQIPPVYSAVKIGGERLYKKARRNSGGELVLAQARSVTIHAIDVLSYQYPELKLRISCSTGTYIRSLARDLGQQLGTGAYVSSLRRTRIGLFDSKDSVSLTELSTGIAQYIHSPATLVRHLPRLTLTSHNVNLLRQGKRIAAAISLAVFSATPIAIFDENKQVTGIATYDPLTSFLSPKINL